MESPLSQRLLEGTFKAGDTVAVDLDGDEDVLVFSKKDPVENEPVDEPQAEESIMDEADADVVKEATT